jgi:allantoinase
MAAYDLVVRGDLVLEDGIVRDGWLAVLEHQVAALGKGGPPGARETVHRRGSLIFPGVVDTHVHTLSEPAEGISAATAAAAAGGVTTIVDMPYDVPEPVYSRALFEDKVERVRAEARVDVGLYGTIRKVGGVGEIPSLIEAGALGFKFSLFETDPVRFPRIGDGDLLAAFECLSGTGIPTVVHAELGEIIDEYSSRVVGRENDATSHGLSRPVVSETAAEVKALELAYWSRVRLHLAHVTHPRGFDLIAWYRSQGASVSGETCIHYLALCDEDVHRIGPRAKVNPPIRDREAREALWDYLERGMIASISSDHAPWAAVKKERPMMAASSGAPGLETLLPVAYTVGTERGLSPDVIARYLCSHPADIYGVGAVKGRLRPGSDADFVVFAPQPRVFDARTAHSTARWSPFDGMVMAGYVESTYVRGVPVYAGGEVVAQPGQGRWLKRTGASLTERAGERAAG